MNAPPKFGLARGRQLPFPVALPAHGFLFHHRRSGAIEGDIQNGNRSSHHHRQAQLHGPLNLCLLARGDIFPAGLRRALHGLAGHFQVGPKFPLLASAIEGGLLADAGWHAAHSGRELRVFDIQFDIGGEWSAMAVRAQVVGPRDGGLAPRGQPWLGAQFLLAGRCPPGQAMLRPSAAGTGNCSHSLSAVVPAWCRPNASPSRSPPDRDGPSCGAPGRGRAGVGLFPARLLGGAFPPFFFRGARGFFLNRSQPPDPLVDLPERAAQFAAAVVGNALEWYDFIVFGFFTVVIARLFFPGDSQYASILLTTATFGVGFFMRPVGGILLGIYADRRGRKAALLMVIALMTVAIAMIAFGSRCEVGANCRHVLRIVRNRLRRTDRSTGRHHDFLR